jgi:hypothetical protein
MPSEWQMRLAQINPRKIKNVRIFLYYQHKIRNYHDNMKEHTGFKQKGTESRGGRYGSGFKKKKGFKKHNNNSNYIDDIFRGVGFKTGNEGPKLYARTIKKIGLYASAHFKNGADVKKCLKSAKNVQFGQQSHCK